VVEGELVHNVVPCVYYYVSGVLRRPVAEMSACILDAIGDYSRSAKPVHLKLVRIVISKGEKMSDFADVLAQKVRENVITSC
jgi:hypothetical protein